MTRSPRTPVAFLEPRVLSRRKGYFYTLTVLFFLLVLLSFFYGSTAIVAQRMDAQQVRVRTMDDFIEDLHRDIDRAAYIAGFRALIALEEHIAATGDFLDDVPGAFASAFSNGTIENETFSVLENSSFGQYIQRVDLEAQKVGIDVNITISAIDLYHIDPWNVAVDYTGHVTIRDLRGQASWEYDRSFSTRIPIYDLRDPLYTVNTYGRVPNTIRRLTNITEFVDDYGDKNDTTALSALLADSSYVASPQAPSFVMRLAGNLSASPYGIESLVNLEELYAQEISVYDDRSVVDYLYFDQPGSADWCEIQNMPETFRLDDAHLSFYEVDPELEYLACP